MRTDRNWRPHRAPVQSDYSANEKVSARGYTFTAPSEREQWAPTPFRHNVTAQVVDDDLAGDVRLFAAVAIGQQLHFREQGPAPVAPFLLRESEPARRAGVVEHIFGLRLRTQPCQFAGIEIKNIDSLFGQILLERSHPVPVSQQTVVEGGLWSFD